MPLIVLSLIAFVTGVVVGSGSSDIDAAKRFASAWERQDFKAMYAELSPDSQAEFSENDFTKRYVDAQSTATATQVLTDEVKAVDNSEGDAAAFEATVDTHAFGQVTGRVELSLNDEHQIDWKPSLVFPGLNTGEVLDRKTTAPARANILTRDGAVLAEGPAEARTSPLGSSALAISGSVGEPSRKQENELYALGFPPGTLAGTSGLELAFNERLSGQPSGQLLAVPEDAKGSANGRILANGDPVKAKPVKTTIDSKAQDAAVNALGATYGGAAVLDARTGDVLGVAGLAFSAPQPPGSTFKVITASAALDAKVTKLSEEFPVESSNSDIGREIPNAHDELCGGSLVTSFADSCNTVFAPLGVRVGEEKMVDMAEAFGFNSPPTLLGGDAEDALAAPDSTIPESFDSDVALGESSIGQGEVLATPLQMASTAQTIANGGDRLPTSLTHEKGLEPDQKPVPVISKDVADDMRTMMIAVVEQGTGVAADSDKYQVAGKTGTAELGPSALDPSEPPPAPGEEPKMDIDAWFTSFAPATKPKYAVATLVIDADADGGTVAAPIAAQIYSSLLG